MHNVGAIHASDTRMKSTSTYSMCSLDTREQGTTDNWGWRRSIRSFISPATRNHFDAQDAVSFNVCPRKSVPASQSRC